MIDLEPNGQVAAGCRSVPFEKDEGVSGRCEFVSVRFVLSTPKRDKENYRNPELGVEVELRME